MPGERAPLGAWVLACLLSLSASAEPAPVTLIWVAPPECPQYEAVWTELAARLGRPPSAPEGGAFAARVSVRHEDSTWVLSVETLSVSGAGRRELRGTTCEEVTHTAVVALSVAIDPLLEAPPTPPERGLWLGVGPRSTFGLLPWFTAGLSLFGTVELGPVSLQLEASASLPERMTVDQGRVLRLAQPIGGGLNGCLAYRWTRVSLLGCLGLRSAAISGVGEGVDRPLLGYAGFLGVGPRVQLQVRLTTWLALRGGVDGDVGLIRPAFQFATGPVVFTSSLFSFSGLLGLEFRAW